MGLYSIQLKVDASERIPEVMTSLGLPVTRVEKTQYGMRYFYKDPRRNKEFAFTTYWRIHGLFWHCGVSPSAMKIAEGFSAAGLFVDEDVA